MCASLLDSLSSGCERRRSFKQSLNMSKSSTKEKDFEELIQFHRNFTVSILDKNPSEDYNN